MLALAAALLLALAPGSAQAEGEACGAPNGDGEVVCDSSTYQSADLEDGQTETADGDGHLIYEDTEASPMGDLSLTIADGVTIASSNDRMGFSNIGMVHVQTHGAGDIDIVAEAGSRIVAPEAERWVTSTSGIRVETFGATGDVSIETSADISTPRGNSISVYMGDQYNTEAPGDIEIDHLAGSLVGGTVDTASGGGINARTFGDGAIDIYSNGAIQSNGQTAEGINARIWNTESDAAISIEQGSSGTIKTTEINSPGIGAYQDGLGAVEIDVAGRIETLSEDAIRSTNPAGINAQIGNWNSTAGISITQRASGWIETHADDSDSRSRGYGIYADHLGLGATGQSAIDIDVAGTVRTHGWQAHGIYAVHEGLGETGHSAINIDVSGTVQTYGQQAHGIYAVAANWGRTPLGDLDVVVRDGAEIRADHDEAHGIWARYDDVHETDGVANVTIEEGASVRGGNYGVYIQNPGARALSAGGPGQVDLGGTAIGGAGGIYLSHGGSVHIRSTGMAAACGGTQAATCAAPAIHADGDLYVKVDLDGRPAARTLIGTIRNSDAADVETTVDIRGLAALGHFRLLDENVLDKKTGVSIGGRDYVILRAVGSPAADSREWRLIDRTAPKPPPSDDPPSSTPPSNTPPSNTPPSNTPPSNTPPSNTPPSSTPPSNTPPSNTPPSNTPPSNTPPSNDSPSADSTPPVGGSTSTVNTFPQNEAGGRGSNSGGGGDGTTLAAGGGAALLAILSGLVVFADDDDDEEDAAKKLRGGWVRLLPSATLQGFASATRLAGSRAGMAGNRAGSSAATGLEAGLTAPLGRGFRLTAAVAPDLVLSSQGLLQAGAASLRGYRHRLGLDWRSGRQQQAGGLDLRVGARASHAGWQAQAAFANPFAAGALGGNFHLAHTHGELGGGVRLALGPAAALRLSAAAFAGRAARSGYRALGTVYHADMPAETRHYHGWKLRLAFGTKGRLSGAGWRAGLTMGLAQLRDNARTFGLTQTDATDWYSFTGRARPHAAPRQVLSLAGGVRLAGDTSWTLGFNGAAARTGQGPVEAVAATTFALRF